MQARAAGNLANILVVDDNRNLTTSVKQLLERECSAVDVASNLEQARERLAETSYRLILVDLMLPDGSGIDLLDDVPDLSETLFVLMTGHPRLPEAVRDSRKVAVLAKPFSAADLLGYFRRAVPESAGESSASVADAFVGWVGSSFAMSQVKRQIGAVAPLGSTVFLFGESGTGKELAANAIHRLSGRSGPLISVNCGAIPETLISNELFGHEKGSYTGAVKAQAGLFERAEGGTVFLDEITELPLEHQPHLLRVLETRTVTRIGSTRAIPVDVRVVAASNRVDEPLVENRILREDLFYRLMVFPIVLPPLRERIGDVAELAEQVLNEWNVDNGQSLRCTADVLKRLEAHAWPGNVRELKHTVQRMAILSKGDTIDAPRFLDGFSGSASAIPVGTTIREAERKLILATLEHFGGDRGRTASTLGISEKTLYNRLKAYAQADAEPADRGAALAPS